MFDKIKQFMERCIPRKINVMDASGDFSDDEEDTSDYDDKHEDVKSGDTRDVKKEQGRKRSRLCDQNRCVGSSYQPKEWPTIRQGRADQSVLRPCI
jgi:hypothetical protein